METDDRTDEAERAFRSIFRHLGRIAIESGVTAPHAYRLLKEAMVEAAVEDFSLDEKRLTDSRVSLLTGVHRKDVRTIRERVEEPDERVPAPTGKPSVVATVIGRWLGDPDLRDADGAPLPLPRQSAKGPSFEALVARVTSDMRPRTLLDELERKGAVTVDPATDTVNLTDRAMIGTDADALYFLGRNAGDHVATIAANMAREAGEPAMLERAVFYDCLDSQAIDALEAMCRREGSAMVEAVNEAALARRDEGADGTGRFRFGVYFYREDDGGAGEE